MLVDFQLYGLLYEFLYSVIAAEAAGRGCPFACDFCMTLRMFVGLCKRAPPFCTSSLTLVWMIESKLLMYEMMGVDPQPW